MIIHFRSPSVLPSPFYFVDVGIVLVSYAKRFATHLRTQEKDTGISEGMERADGVSISATLDARSETKVNMKERRTNMRTSKQIWCKSMQKLKYNFENQCAERVSKAPEHR